MWGDPPTGNGGWGVFARRDERKRITDMATTEVQTPMNATARPSPYAPFVGARVVAGLIDLALVVGAVAPLALLDLGIAAVVGFVLAAVYSTILEVGLQARPSASGGPGCASSTSGPAAPSVIFVPWPVTSVASPSSGPAS